MREGERERGRERHRGTDEQMERGKVKEERK